MTHEEWKTNMQLGEDTPGAIDRYENCQLSLSSFAMAVFLSVSACLSVSFDLRCHASSNYESDCSGKAGKGGKARSDYGTSQPSDCFVHDISKPPPSTSKGKGNKSSSPPTSPPLIRCSPQSGTKRKGGSRVDKINDGCEGATV
eukprot:CAMPEP_0116549968 /NCGR_PEP_ID=MMETSP0397-20121206/5170_1 /TAXON_ID=216820 /ORGANISM="Cyclophora tenuis, Strain ECT3854" /LENGTH=143 /DNA_ID=CAMNT_0004074755 /DNA_START=85 /DNA_END=513 /DNA_ORIENTATION=-